MIDYKKYLNSENIFFQIGAHDGILGEEYGLQDHMNDLKNTFYFVEPVPEFMNNLKENYKNYICKKYYIECAVRDYDGLGEIHLQKGSTSFHISSGNKINVKVKKLLTILQEYKINKIDMLLIDAEMCEYEIINNLDFNIIKPQIIRYEYHLLKDFEKKSIEEKLSVHYNIDTCAHDSIHNKVCVLK